MLSAVKTASSRSASTPGAAAAPADTPDKLIAAAERLFADNGYTNVSVRAIAAAAGVNWSLVGYYFRGKEGLLSEVYRRHCSSLNAERLKLLGLARRKGLELEAIIEAFVRPALAEIQTGHGETSFSRLRAILAAEDSALLNQLVADNFDMSSRTFVAALRHCLPAGRACRRDPLALPLHARHDLLFGRQPPADQDLLEGAQRSRQSRGHASPPRAIPRRRVPGTAPGAGEARAQAGAMNDVRRASGATCHVRRATCHVPCATCQCDVRRATCFA